MPLTSEPTESVTERGSRNFFVDGYLAKVSLGLRHRVTCSKTLLVCISKKVLSQMKRDLTGVTTVDHRK